MQNIKTKSLVPHQPSNAVNAAAAPKSNPDWKPQPCGLTREELRKIVEEILG
jgi:hypothetical protein